MDLLAESFLVFARPLQFAWRCWLLIVGSKNVCKLRWGAGRVVRWRSHLLLQGTLQLGKLLGVDALEVLRPDDIAVDELRAEVCGQEHRQTTIRRRNDQGFGVDFGNGAGRRRSGDRCHLVPNHEHLLEGRGFGSGVIAVDAQL